MASVEKLIPYVSLGTQERRDEFFSDGLHLTPRGYDEMGTRIYEALLPELMRPDEYAM